MYQGIDTSSNNQNGTASLKKHYRVIVMDTRGHGRSGRGEGQLNFTRFARDAAVAYSGPGDSRDMSANRSYPSSYRRRPLDWIPVSTGIPTR